MRTFLIAGLVGLLMHAPSKGDQISVFLGPWGSVNPPGPHVVFTKIGASVEGSLPNLGQAMIKESNGEDGSNFVISGRGFRCLYMIVVFENSDPIEMTWELKSGSVVCPKSALLRFFGPKLPRSFPTRTTSWIQNESKMSMVAVGDKVEFYYEVPTEFLQETGISKDTLKFEGKKFGDSYSGTAYVYTRHCWGKRFGYEVSGNENDDGTQI